MLDVIGLGHLEAGVEEVALEPVRASGVVAEQYDQRASATAFGSRPGRCR